MLSFSLRPISSFRKVGVFFSRLRPYMKFIIQSRVRDTRYYGVVQVLADCNLQCYVREFARSSAHYLIFTKIINFIHSVPSACSRYIVALVSNSTYRTDVRLVLGPLKTLYLATRINKWIKNKGKNIIGGSVKTN